MPSLTTSDKVCYLSSGASYPGFCHEVEVIETHMSWVFLAGDTVYKLKKPVKYSFLDFTTLAAREEDCLAEVRLNERLAPGIYIGVVPLTLDRDGNLSLNGSDDVVDWLVKMRRLPNERMLDRAIALDTVSSADIEKVVAVLADFYRRTPRADLTPADYVNRFCQEHEVNRSLLMASEFGLPGEAVKQTLNTVEEYISVHSSLLSDRVTKGHVVEGHGDLRPEHICLLDPPVIIDCLEFNRALRLVDPFEEVAFLGLECERLGAGWIGNLVLEQCGKIFGDAPRSQLFAFYTMFRALLRARLALAHLLESDPRDPGKWIPLAKQYLAIAERESLKLGPRGARRSIHPHDNA